MAAIIFLALVATPIIEIIIFIRAGEAFGLWPTVGAVVITAFIGTILLRQQGFSVLRSVQETVNAGQTPVAEIFHGFCVVIGGALLLTPGFLTDAIGFALLTPPFRRLLGRLLATVAARRVHVTVEATQAGMGRENPRPRSGRAADEIIEGEFQEVTETPAEDCVTPNREDRHNRHSPWHRGSSGH